jgi:hypothetical protein
MINGAHVILYSKNADADRAFLRDVLAFPSVDVGGGWLIFALPPSEVAVHPSGEGEVHALYLMCDTIEAFVADMTKRGIATSPIENQGWGLLTHVTLPGGGKLGVYEPRHARPEPATVAATRAKRATAKKATAKKATAKKATAKKATAKKATAKKAASKKRGAR